MLELVVALEEEFGIEISDDAPLGHITSSVDSIAEYLRQTVLSDDLPYRLQLLAPVIRIYNYFLLKRVLAEYKI